MHVEPVSEYPPATSRTLGQWLDPSSAAQVPPEVRTRLREIADARATRAGMWSAFLSIGASAVMFATVVYSVNGNPRTMWWAVAGAIVALASLLMLRRARLQVPKTGASATTRGPAGLGNGLIAAGSIFLALNAFLVPSALLNGNTLPIVFIDLGMLLLLVSVFVVPAAVIGRARASLRRAARRHPQLLDALEQERLTWTQRTGGAEMFGPL